MILLLGYLLLTVVVGAVLFYALVALLPSGLSVPPQRDDRPFVLPAGRRMHAEDLDAIRIPVSLRGYRFAEADDLIDRLAAEIVVRDEEIARLRERPRTSAELPPFALSPVGTGPDRIEPTEHAVPEHAVPEHAVPEHDRIERTEIEPDRIERTEIEPDRIERTEAEPDRTERTAIDRTNPNESNDAKPEARDQ